MLLYPVREPDEEGVPSRASWQDVLMVDVRPGHIPLAPMYPAGYVGQADPCRHTHADRRSANRVARD